MPEKNREEADQRVRIMTESASGNGPDAYDDERRVLSMTCGTDCPTCGMIVPADPPRWTAEALSIGARGRAENLSPTAVEKNRESCRLDNIRREDEGAAKTLRGQRRS